MAGGHTGAARFLRTTNISGNVYQQLTTAGSAAVLTTVNSYSLGGLFATIQFVPTTTQTASATVPAAPSTAANKGWRDDVAEDAANQITWDAVNWTVRLRLKASASITVRTTVIVYRQNGSGTTEMGRVAVDTALTTTTASVTHTVPVSAGLVFAAGDKIQVEVYTTTLLAGVAAAPATATTVTCTIGESDANGGSKITPGTYSQQVVRALTTEIALAGAFAKLIAASRSFTTPVTLASTVRRDVILSPRTAVLTLAASVTKQVIPTAKVAALTLSATVTKLVTLPVMTAALSLAGSFSRLITAARSFTTAITLSTSFARAIISARSFSTSITLTSDGSVQITFTILRRLAVTLTLSRGEVY